MLAYRVMSEDQARAIAAAAQTLNWQQGKARKRELEGSIKNNDEVLSADGLKLIGKALSSNKAIQIDHLPYQIHPPKFSRYREGQRYHLHTDAPWMAKTRTDLSCTLWLSDDYDGGELVIGGKGVKGKPGEAVIYDCGAPHEVRPVTRGERICAVTWMQSRVRDPVKRKIITDLRKLLAKIEDSDPDLFLFGGRIHSALLRIWMD